MSKSETSPRPPAGRRLPARVAVIVLALALPLSACTAEDPLAQQARAGDSKNYIAGDGSITEYAPAKRKEPVRISAMLFDGSKVDSVDWAGKVTVLNFWYAACAPCRLEAPDLQALNHKFKGEDVQFYGVNVRDEAATAAAFERTFGLTYPSINDRDGGVLLALAGTVPPRAVPTTLVLDKRGRVAARILGTADKGTLRTLIADTLKQ